MRLSSKFLLVTLTVFMMTVFVNARELKLRTADLIETNLIQSKCLGLTSDYEQIELSIKPAVNIVSFERKGPYLAIKLANNLKEGVIYTLSYNDPLSGGSGEIGVNTTLLVEERFNQMYSDKELGYIYDNASDTSIFRLFVPRGKKVNVVIFEKYDDETGEVFEMRNDGNQVFEYKTDGALWGKYYGYQIVERSYSPSFFVPNIPKDTIFADPYSRVIATNNVYPQKGRTLIYDTSNFDWQGTDTQKMDLRDAVILEMHIRDITAHPTAQSENPGTYKGMIDAKVGGINYIKKLGVNAVEFLPIHDFGNVEPPFNGGSHGIKNTWNAYAENYWGYMTFNFFSPETYYATDGSLEAGKWNGTDGRAVVELKETIRELHKNGISVLLDVVYNHISQYDENALKLIDYEYYFKKNSGTGCGNEVETRRRMVRRMVIDSIKYWMTEYKIDGFRFDLAASHDNQTVKDIFKEAKALNPDVYLIAEPWGGEGATTSGQFLEYGWSKWNDGSRGAIRGGNNRPNEEGMNFMLGGPAQNLAHYWRGTSAGQPHQSVDYSESHDDATLGDIIRVLSGHYKFKNFFGKPNRIRNMKRHIKLPNDLIDASKVGATALFLCQGPVMIHLGQEWARSKVTPDLKGEVPEVIVGDLGKSSDNVVYLTQTPNSYSADNDTNYINFDYIQYNQDLFDYYQGLIALRKAQPLLGRGDPEKINILRSKNKNNSSLGVEIEGSVYGFVNSNPKDTATFTIPEGSYDIMANKDSAGTKSLGTMNGGEITVDKAASLILVKK